MTVFDVLGVLLSLVIGSEILASIAILISWKIRAVSLLLAGFTLVFAVMFHANFSDETQMIIFLKIVSIA